MYLLSRLYAFLYWSTQRRVLGLSVRAWLIVGGITLLVVGFAGRWPIAVSVAAAFFLALLFVLYAVGGRTGYKRFVADRNATLDLSFAAPIDEMRVPLRATGVFSLRHRESYVLQRPAEYWRVPIGHHVVMVQEQPGRYLYQIIDATNVSDVEPGYLLHGERPQMALAVKYAPSWGPDFADTPSFYYVGTVDSKAKSNDQRTVYFSFDHEADRFAVWRSLTGNHRRD